MHAMHKFQDDVRTQSLYGPSLLSIERVPFGLSFTKIYADLFEHINCEVELKCELLVKSDAQSVGWNEDILSSIDTVVIGHDIVALIEFKTAMTVGTTRQVYSLLSDSLRIAIRQNTSMGEIMADRSMTSVAFQQMALAASEMLEFDEITGTGKGLGGGRIERLIMIVVVADLDQLHHQIGINDIDAYISFYETQRTPDTQSQLRDLAVMRV